MSTHTFNEASYYDRNEVPSASCTKANLKNAGCDYVHGFAAPIVILPRGYTALRLFHPLDPQGLTASPLGIQVSRWLVV